MRLLNLNFRWICYGMLVFLSSCVSMGKISIQVSVPAQRAIPADIQSIVIMNRSMNSTYSNLDQDSLEQLFVTKKLELDDLLLDSLAADTTLKTVGNALYESGRFDVVIPLLRNIPNNNTSYLTKSPFLSLAQVNHICKEFNVDALLLLENFYENVKTSHGIVYDPTLEYGRAEINSIDIQIAYYSKWNLYQPGEKLKAASFEIKDTIFWERTGPSLQKTYEKMPTIKEALLFGAVENGLNLTAYISPGWQQQRRSYYITKNKEADKAIEFLNNNNWEEARETWMKFSNASSVGLRSQIEFNLALASEMNGDLKEAINWVEKSKKSKYSKVTEDYLNLLNKRLSMVDSK